MKERWKIRRRKWEWYLRRLFTRYVVVPTRQGVFELDLRDESISWKLFVLRNYELNWVNKVISFLSASGRYPDLQKGTVLDIGANNGVISIGMLYHRQFQRAIAIEPEPHNFELLNRNVVLNHLQDRIISLPSAVSDKQGEVEFEVSQRYLGVHRIKRDPDMQISTPLVEREKRQITRIPCDTIDHLLEGLPAEFTNNIRLIWIDIQGYEGHAFQGAKNLLSRGIPVVAELWPYGIVSGGMTADGYCEIARKFWQFYWALDEEELTRHPISELGGFIDALGYVGKYTNIILTK